MVDSINTENTVYQTNTGSRMGQVSAESYETPEYLREGINRSRQELAKFRPEQKPLVEKIETKAEPQTTNSKCPAQSEKPAEVKPKELTDKEKLDAAKKEKAELFKDLQTKDISPKEAIKLLKDLKETFSALDNSFRLKIEENQKARDSYKPSSHTDIDGNNGKAGDQAFYNSNNASTLEYTGLRSEVHKEMSSINKKILDQEMRFLRA
jgi:hypothetical protein